MAKADIDVRRTDTILDELNQLQRRISERAYELFRDRGALWGDTLKDWLDAERDVLWKPAVDVHRKDGQIEILTALPGVEAKDIDVQVTPEDVLIKAVMAHEHKTAEGATRACEIDRGAAFRSVHLPAQIDPNSVKAEYRNGLLRLTAAVAKTAVPRKVDIKAA